MCRGEGREAGVVPRPRHRGISQCLHHPQAGGESQLGDAQVAPGPCGAQELFLVFRMVGKGAVCQQDPLSSEAGLCPGSWPGFTHVPPQGSRLPLWRKRMQVGLPFPCAHQLSLLGTAPLEEGLDFLVAEWLDSPSGEGR